MPDQNVLRGADPVNDELEVGYNEIFERRFYRVAVVARFFLGLCVAASAAGLLGRGPFSHRTEVSADKQVAVNFEPIARYDAPTQVTLHVHPLPSQDTVTVIINSKFIEPMTLQATQPAPLTMAAHGGGLALTFAVSPDQKDTLLRLNLKPATVGLVRLSADVVGEGAISWEQMVLP